MGYDLIVVGAGPAGLTAGIYAARSELDSLIFESKTPGGQVAIAPKIENYPGFPDGIVGLELAKRMEKQARDVGVGMKYEEVKDITQGDEDFIVETSTQKYRSMSVIIASGLSHKKLGIKGEEDFLGKGISYCATCDGPFFRGKRVAVIGNGTPAVVSALTLNEFADVEIISGDTLRTPERVLLRRVKESNIEVLSNLKPVEIVGDRFVEGVKVKDIRTHEDNLIEVDGIFVEAGKIPNTSFLSFDVALDKRGYIIVDSKQKTNVDGLFAAGDVTTVKTKQIATAVAQGSIAALGAYEWSRWK